MLQDDREGQAADRTVPILVSILVRRLRSPPLNPMILPHEFLDPSFHEQTKKFTATEMKPNFENKR